MRVEGEILPILAPLSVIPPTNSLWMSSSQRVRLEGAGGQEGDRRPSFSHLVGKTVVDGARFATLSQEGKSTDDVVSRDSLPAGCRVLPPGAIVTMDYRADRLNVNVDKDNKVVSVHYG